MAKFKLVLAFVAGATAYAFLAGDLLLAYLVISYCRGW